MKKYSALLLLIICLLTSFKEAGNRLSHSYFKDKQLFVIYIDNSRDKSKVTESLSDSMYSLISRRIDQIKTVPNAVIAFYVSNDKPQWASDIARAKTIVQNLDYTILPDIYKDNGDLSNRLFGQDLSDVKSVNIDYFVTEFFLAKGLMNDNGGLFINGFPNKLQNYINNESIPISVNLFYPLVSKTVTKDAVVKYFSFQNGFNFNNRIQYSFNPL